MNTRQTGRPTPICPRGMVLAALLWTGAAGGALGGEGQAAAAFHGSTDLRGWPDARLLPCLTVAGLGSGGTAPAPSLPAPAQADMAKAVAELEARLARLTPGSAEYTALQGALAALHSATTSASTPPPAPASVAYRALTTPQALSNLYASLADHLSPQAWQAVQNSAALADPDHARLVALVATAHGTPLAAVAAYLKVVQAQPKNADALYNLGALAASLSAPNEALALLAASEAAGGPTNHFYPARAQLLSTRGFALLRVGRAEDAVQVLQQATALAPDLPEAQRNLASALGTLGRCPEAQRALALGVRRNPAPRPPAAPATPPVALPPGALPTGVALPDAAEAGGTDVLARDVLDFSRGTAGPWPYFPVIVEPEEVDKLNRLDREYADWIRRNELTSAQAGQTVAALRDATAYLGELKNDPARVLTDRVSVLLFGATTALFVDPVYRPLYDRQQQAQLTYTRNEADSMASMERKVRASRDTRQKEERACSGKQVLACLKKAEYDDMNRECTAAKDWNNLWRGSIPYLETATRAQTAELDRYYSTVASYISEPRLLHFPQALHRNLRRLFMQAVPDAILEHLSQLAIHQAPCVFLQRTPPPSPDEQVGTTSDPADPGCQTNTTYKAHVEFVEFSGNCGKFGLELTAKLPFLDLGAFVSIEQQFSAGQQTPPGPNDAFLKSQGNVTPEHLAQFGQRQGDLSVFCVSAGVKGGVGVGGTEEEAKGAFYLTFDSHNTVNDFGVKAETSATQGVGIDVLGVDIGAGIELAGPGGQISLMPGPELP